MGLYVNETESINQSTNQSRVGEINEVEVDERG
jgi:hypothetical protein